MRKYLSLIVLGLLSSGCQLTTVPNSVDFGKNDYMPLAVGNKWKYRTMTRIQIDYPLSPSSISVAYSLEQWEVVSVKIQQSGVEEFTIAYTTSDTAKNGTFTVLRKDNTLTVRNYELKRTGTADTLFLNDEYHFYIKGIGMGRKTWGYNERRYSEFNDQRLVEYSLKP